MRILVTGGTGTISSGIVAESVRQGNDTYAITRGRNNDRNVIGAQYIQANIWDEEAIHSILKQQTFDIVVECLVYNCNQLQISLRNFADRCAQYVFISTTAVYGQIEGEKRLSEEAPQSQTEWEYSRNKIECEKMLAEFFVNRRNKYTIVRPVVTYGDYRIPFPIATRKPTWTLFERMKRGVPVVACTNAEHSVMHSSDFSRAVVGLFGNSLAMNDAFHISSNGNEVFWDNVIAESGRIMGVVPKIVHVSLDVIKIAWPSIYNELKWNKAKALLLDDSKLRSVIPDFSYTIDIKSGLNKTIEAAQKEFILQGSHLDLKWWDRCDIAILCAYYRNELVDEERLYAKEYIDTLRIKKRIVLILKYLKERFRYR